MTLSSRIYAAFMCCLVSAATPLQAQTWTPQVSGTTDWLMRVTYLTPTTAVVVGEDGTILRSSDGGVTWTPRVSGTGVWLLGITSPTASVAVAVGDFGTILRSSDGGVTWNSQVIHCDQGCTASMWSRRSRPPSTHGAAISQ